MATVGFKGLKLKAALAMHGTVYLLCDMLLISK